MGGNENKDDGKMGMGMQCLNGNGWKWEWKWLDGSGTGMGTRKSFPHTSRLMLDLARASTSASPTWQI